MDAWCIIIIIVFTLITIFNIFYIFSLRSSIKEISDELDEKLKGDTNTLVSISSSDKVIKKFAYKINEQLSILRNERLKLEYGNNELKNAITNISHDLRTPLTAISGYVELMKQEDVSENSKRYLEIISERTKTMCMLTEELFQYSVTTCKMDSLEEEVVCMNDIIEESIASYYYDLEKQKIIPTIQFPDEKVFRVLDRKAFRRICDNIISNAIKYSDGDLDIKLTSDGKLTFTNSAKELDGVKIKLLFNRFFTVQTARESTGLGLSIAKLLTEKMGGNISANYDNGKLSISICFLISN